MTTSASVSGGAQQEGVRSWTTALELVVLGAVWGGSFLFMRMASGPFGASVLVELRLLFGALVLSPFLYRAHLHIKRSQWPYLLLAALLSSALPFFLFAWGAERAPAGIGAITNSLAVLFTALIGFLLYGQRISRRRVIALFTGFFGVVVLMSHRTGGSGIVLAALAGTTAACCYGFSANIIKHHLSELPPVMLAAISLWLAALMMLVPAALNLPAVVPPASAWLAAVCLGMVCTGIAYGFYFRLIKRIGAARAVTSTYLVPMFAVLWAWLWLGEAITPQMICAGALILGGVIFSQRDKAPRG
ncbi:DMT family transporter [Frateuria aurantia]